MIQAWFMESVAITTSSLFYRGGGSRYPGLPEYFEFNKAISEIFGTPPVESTLWSYKMSEYLDLEMRDFPNL
jgi:hypothetical protein